MLRWEYSQEAEHRALKEESREEGREEGILTAAFRLLKKGMGLNEVAAVLELTTAQEDYLKKTIA